MGALRDSVADPAKRKQVIEDSLKVLDKEVDDKGGLSGMALKATYAVAKGVAPGIMYKIVDKLMDEFLDALEPFHTQAKAQGVDVAKHMTGQAGNVANALLSITDSRAAKEQGGVLKKGYEKMRPAAQKHVEQAVPRLADLIKQYAP
jgi:hypothetical protein